MNATPRSVSKSENLAMGQNAVRRPGKRNWLDTLVPYLFISPFLLSFLVLFVGPAIYSLVLSFYRYQGYGTATWVGFNNYDATLNYELFWTELGNTIFYWLAHSIPLVIIAFLLAVLVYSKLVEHKRVFKPLLFMPQLVAAVAAALVFKNFFGTQYGLLNTVLGTKVQWLDNSEIARWVVVFVIVWRSTAYWFVVFLAGLTAINPEINEAATVDGASAWQQMIHITIPLMRRTFLVFFVLDAVWAMRLFETPNVLTGAMGGLAPAAMAPILNLIVSNVQSALFGQAAATGWLLFIVIGVISFIQFRLFRERNEEA